MADRDFEAILDAGAPPETEVLEQGARLDRWWARVSADEGVRRLYRVGVPVAVTATAAATRLYDLGHPRELVFDETFYVKDGWSLWNLGYSSQWPDSANDGF